MTEVLDGLFALLIFVTVALTALGIGLVTTWEKIGLSVRRRTFYALIGINVVVVPVVAYLTILTIPLEPGAATGVIICAICAAGPLGLKTTQISHGDLPWTLSLIVTLLTLNVVALPAWSTVLLDQALTLSPVDVLRALAPAIVAPVALGIWMGGHHRRAARLSSIATTTSNVTLVLAVIVGVAANIGGLLASLSSWVFLVVLVVVVIAGLLGRLARGDLERRRASTLVTLNRATSVALLVIGRTFPDNPEVFTAAVVFGLVQTVVAIGLSLYWGLVRMRLARTAAA